MAVTNQKKSRTKKQKIDILKCYMDFVLEQGEPPKSIYKFCKENNIKEEEFYQQYGSFQSLQKAVWTTFHEHTLALMKKNDNGSTSPKEQLLTYFFTLFELLTLNRSYCLLILETDKIVPMNFSQLELMRKRIKQFSSELIILGNERKSSKLFQHNETLFSEGVWVQFLFLLRFWVKDTSPGFEKTDIAIEKSVKTAIDIFETTPLESLIDFGKFLWKEQKM